MRKPNLIILSFVSLIFAFSFAALNSSPRKTEVKSSPDSGIVLGDWFSDIVTTTPGVFTHSIRLYPNGEFKLYKILLHPYMRWEEARYEGKWVQNADHWKLNTEICHVYTSRSLMERRALLRAYDCDHLVMELRWEEGMAKLSPSMYGENSEIIFRRPLNELGRTPRTKEKWGRVFFDGNRFIVWGIDIRYLKVGQRGKVFFENGTYLLSPMSEVVDTSAEIIIQSKVSPDIGAFFLYP